MVKEFNKALEYAEQERKISEVQHKTQYEVTSLRSEIGALRSLHASKIRSAAVSGENIDAELDGIESQIAEKERLLKRREMEEAAVLVAEFERKISPADVVQSWNAEYIPDYQAKVHQPLVKAMRDAKRAYAEAASKYHESIRFIEDKKNEVSSVLGDGYRYKLNHVKSGNQADFDYVAITNLFIRTINNNETNEESRKLLEGK